MKLPTKKKGIVSVVLLFLASTGYLTTEATNTFNEPIEAAPAEVTFTTLSVSGGTVEPNDENVLIYSFQMDVSGNTAMISGFYVTLNGESDENDFAATSFELLAGSPDANIDNATSLRFTDFGGEVPIPAHGIGWLLGEEYAEGSTTVFFIRAGASNAPVDGSSFRVAEPTGENFGFEKNGKD